MTTAGRGRFAGLSIQCAGIVLATILACAAGQTSPDRVRPAEEAAVLANSEMEYTDSGGFAGRVHRARLVATAGRVTVEYRPAEPSQMALLRGTLEPNRYMELWREAERIGVWTMSSPPKSPGADMIESELRVRLDARSHVVRWQPEAAVPASVAGAVELGRRILAVAGQLTQER